MMMMMVMMMMMMMMMMILCDDSDGGDDDDDGDGDAGLVGSKLRCGDTKWHCVCKVVVVPSCSCFLSSRTASQATLVQPPC